MGRRGRPDRSGRLGRSGWPKFEVGESIATRKGSQGALTSLVDSFPGLIGGSADLTGSNGTKTGSEAQTSDNPWRPPDQLRGARARNGGGLMVGAALHGGVIPFGGTFLVFSDYMRPAVRLAALCRRRSASSCGHTIRWVLARTALPTNRWNTS